jgi:hypothetical protein
MKERVSATFLGLRVDNRLNWKDHINQMIPKSSQQDTHTVDIHVSDIEAPKLFCFAYFHSVITYGVMFWR